MRLAAKRLTAKRFAAELARFAALERARGLKPEVVSRYSRDVSDLLGFLRRRAKEDLREVEAEELVAYLLYLERRGWAADSVTARLGRLRKVFDYLQRRGMRFGNPASGLHRKRADHPLREGLAEDEVFALLDTVDLTRPIGVRNRAMLELLYSSGLRTGELRRLTLDDLDLASGFVTVGESKSGRGRRVPMGRVATAWVARYLKQVRPGLVRHPTLAVFLGEKAGQAVWNADVNKALSKAAAKARIRRHVSAHLLRHTCAIHLLRNGASTRHVQELLGHRQLDSTQLYTRLVPQELKRVHARCHPNERSRPPGTPRRQT